jgi:sulfur-oxidizing protein SoxX
MAPRARFIRPEVQWHAMLFSTAIGLAAGPAPAQPPVAYKVNANSIQEPLTTEPGDVARGRDVVLNRNEGGCLLCHAVPRDNDERTRFMGDIAPPLAGVGARLSAGQLRLRLVDSTLLNPVTVMPAYYRVDGLNQVAAAYRGKPILTAQQIEDAVAYLSTLKDVPR